MDPIWNELHQRPGGWGRWPSEEVVRVVKRMHPHRAGRRQVRILDLGCGGGAIARMLDEEGFDFVAIDGSAEAVQRAVGVCERGHFSQADICLPLDFPNGFFHGVIDNFSLCHNRPHEQAVAFAEVRRILAPGGWFYSAHFGAGTAGASWCYPDDGPLAGRGFVAITNAADLLQRMQCFGDPKQPAPFGRHPTVTRQTRETPQGLLETLHLLA